MGIETIVTILSAVGSLAQAAGAFGGGKAPSVQTSAPTDIKNSASSTANRTAALLATQGGSAGETLAAGSTSKNDTLLGN